jgi:serine/threonine-protein kinase
MSPEQAQGKPVDACSDIFSFRLVLYEMLSGRRAFAGESNFAIMTAIVKDEPPPLQTSPSLEKIVRRCLAKQPSGRYQRMSEVKTALEQVLEERGPGRSAEPQPSIAVLPFADMSPGKDNEWFSDGLAEEIINVLAHIPGLRVIARTSAFAFKGKQEDVRKIAEALGVTNMLEGSVRKAGNRIRVTAQLISAADGSHLWSERYDRDMADAFAIQDEIAIAIAGALKVKLSVQPAAQRRHEPNLAAHEAYLKARYHWGKLRPESIARCKEYSEQAIALDPEFALAHCGYADYFLAFAAAGYLPAHEAMPLLREEAQEALEIDPSQPEAHAMLGIVAGVYDYDWKEAERCFCLALAHDPVPPSVRQWYGWFYLLPMGRTEEALAQLEQGLKSDPLNVMARITLAAALLWAGRLAEAQAEAHKALEFEESHVMALSVLPLIYARQEKWTEALHFAEKASSLSAIGILAGVLRRMGEVKRAEELIQRIMPGEAYGAPSGLTFFYLVCGEIDRAADWLEKAIEQRHPNAAANASMYLRSSSRWPELAKLMNLPEEAR